MIFANKLCSSDSGLKLRDYAAILMWVFKNDIQLLDGGTLNGRAGSTMVCKVG